MRAMNVRMLSWKILLVVCGLFVTGGAGCSDDKPGADLGLGATDRAVPGADGSAVDLSSDSSTAGSLTFLVFEYSQKIEVPLEGATVALDLPGAQRVEQTTGADGAAVFEGIDFTAGDVTATAHFPGYTMETFGSLNPDALPSNRLKNGVLKFHLSPGTPTIMDEVTLSGTAQGLVDPTHRYLVSAVGVKVSEVGTQWIGWGAQNYEIKVPRGVPFTIQGVEMGFSELPSGQGNERPIYRIMHQDFPAMTEDITNVALDFAAFEVSTTAVDTSIDIPTRADSPIRTGYPQCGVYSNESTHQHGYAARVELEPANDQVKVSFVWPAPSWARDVETMCGVLDKTSGALSIGREEGYPEAGVFGQPLFDVPRWILPANAEEPPWRQLQMRLNDN